jgi:hypothetical protein
MPPQPLGRITPNQAVDFDPAKLATVPQLTALPMTVIAIWGTIDGILAKMLAHMMSSDLAVGVAIFHAIKSQDAQRAAILGAAEKSLCLDDYKLLQVVLKVTRASRERRHDYSHHLWGIPTIPDALALLDPRDSLKEIVILEERMEEFRRQMGQISEMDKMAIYYHPQQPRPQPPPIPPQTIDAMKIMVFKEKDLKADLKEAEQALLLYRDLQRALFGPSLEAKSEARLLLLAVPRIARAFRP